MDANDSPIPGPDAIKLFIGGIPKDYFEEEMRGELERFGVICRLKVLRDPFSGHRGESTYRENTRMYSHWSQTVFGSTLKCNCKFTCTFALLSTDMHQ